MSLRKLDKYACCLSYLEGLHETPFPPAISYFLKDGEKPGKEMMKKFILGDKNTCPSNRERRKTRTDGSWQGVERTTTILGFVGPMWGFIHDV